MRRRGLARRYGRMRSQKMAAREDRAAWEQSNREGRTVRYGNGDRFTSFPTRKRALKALAVARAKGLRANIVGEA